MPETPALWLDWCAVVGHDPDDRSPEHVDRFTRMASPSSVVIAALTHIPEQRGPQAAPAWPTDTSGAPAPGLGQTLAALCWVGRDGLRTNWPHLLRARRDAYLMVLLGPPEQGGLGLSRAAAVGLRPARLMQIRDQIGVSTEGAGAHGGPASCPACAVHRWLHVAGLYADWSLASVRSLVNTRLDLENHSCGHLPGLPNMAADDPEPGWIDSKTLLPAIDQYGAFDLWRPLTTRAVTSILALRTAEAIYATPPAPEEEREPLAPVTRHFTGDEVEDIFDEADEVNRRLKALLDDTEGALKNHGKA